MNLSLCQCYFMLTTTILVGLCTLKASEGKDKSRTMKLCGVQFLKYYQYVCGAPSTAFRGRRSMANIEKKENKEIPKLPKLPVVQKQKDVFPTLKEKLAKQFLRRVKRMPRSAMNAHEECCVETCTVEEVNEYPCYGIPG